MVLSGWLCMSDLLLHPVHPPPPGYVLIPRACLPHAVLFNIQQGDDDEICDIFNSGHYHWLCQTCVVVDREMLRILRNYSLQVAPQYLPYTLCTRHWILFLTSRVCLWPPTVPHPPPHASPSHTRTDHLHSLIILYILFSCSHSFLTLACLDASALN